MTHKKGTPSSCYSLDYCYFFNFSLCEMQMRWQEKITYQVCSFLNKNIGPLLLSITVSFVRFFFSPPTPLLVRFFTLIVFDGVKYHSVIRIETLEFEADLFILGVLAYCELIVVLGGVRLCVCEKVHKFTLPFGGGWNLFPIKRKICLSIPLRHSTREHNRFDEFVREGELINGVAVEANTLTRRTILHRSLLEKSTILRGFQSKFSLSENSVQPKSS